MTAPYSTGTALVKKQTETEKRSILVLSAVIWGFFLVTRVTKK
jgi:hypothetical protein